MLKPINQETEETGFLTNHRLTLKLRPKIAGLFYLGIGTNYLSLFILP